VIAVAGLVWWMWELDPGPTRPPVDIGGGIRVPVHLAGPMSHSWWAMVVLLLVAGSIYGCALFSYLYLWLVSPQVWPGSEGLPDLGAGVAAAALIALSSLAVHLGHRALGAGRLRTMSFALAAAVLLFAAGFGVDLYSHHGLSPGESSYGASVALLVSLEGFYGMAVIAMALYALAYHRAGRLDRVRRAVFDNTRLLWHYTVAQSLAGLALVHGFARLAAA
jgi:heme/copper-type cytochrome/quinol oxidase subunit 3